MSPYFSLPLRDFQQNRLEQMPTAWGILIVVVLSLAVKLGYIFILGGGLAAFPSEGSDVEFYFKAAQVLLKTGEYGNQVGHPTTAMPPGQSVFLALLYALGGGSIALIKLAHVTLLTLAAVLTYLTGKAVAGRAVGLAAGVLIALDPAYAYLANTFLSEPLFIFLMMAGIYLLLRAQTLPTSPNRATAAPGIWLLAAGACFGLAGLTRNQGWLLALALWLGAVVTRGRLITLRHATLVLLATFVVIAPWTYRNYLLSGHLILVSSEGGLTLWASNNPEFEWRPPMPMSRPVYRAPPGLSEYDLDQYYRQRAFEWLASHPINFVINGLRKVLALYSFDPLSLRPQAASLFRLAGLFPYGVMLPLIVVGLIANLTNRRLGIILWYILFTTLLAALFYGDSRIRTPIQPYLYLMGVLGIRAAVQWWREKKAHTMIAAETKAGTG